MEKVLLEHIAGHTKVNGKSQHGFTQRKSRLCDLNISLKKVTGFVDEERPVRVIYLTLSQAFGNVLRNILVPKLGCYSLGGWRTRWLKSRLHGQAQRVAISVFPLSGGWQPVEYHLLGLSRYLFCSVSLPATWRK